MDPDNSNDRFRSVLTSQSSSSTKSTSNTAEFLLTRWASADSEQANLSQSSASTENISGVPRNVQRQRKAPTMASTPTEVRTGGDNENVSVSRNRKVSECRRALTNSIRHHDRILEQSGVAQTRLHDPTDPPPIVIPKEVDNDDWSCTDRRAMLRNYVNASAGFISVYTEKHSRQKLYIAAVAIVVLSSLVAVTVIGSVRSIEYRRSSTSALATIGDRGGGEDTAPADAAGSKQEGSGLRSRAGDGDSISANGSEGADVSDTSLPAQRSHQISSNTVEAHLVDVYARQLNGKELPFFFNVPSAGGLTMQRVTRQCASLLEASEAGRGHDMEAHLVVHERPVGSGNRFVNVDTSNQEGIKRARDLNVIKSDIVQVFYSPLLHDSSTLFTPQYRGQMFAIFRHPVQRAIHSYNTLANGAATESQLTWFAVNGKLENNLMTRLLVGKETGTLTDEDLEQAKAIIRAKCVVGLAEELKDSILRFSKHFSWGLGAPDKSRCVDRLVTLDGRQIPNDLVVDEESDLWRLIMKENDRDTEVYEYAVQIYAEQASMFT